MLNRSVRGTGRPLVVLPGFGLDSGVMAAAFEEQFAGDAAERTYVDLPGLGSPPSAPTSEAVLAAVVDVVRAFSEPVGVVGLSYGGYLARALAARHPERVAGLFLVCPGVVIPRDRRDLTGVLPSRPATGDWLDDVPGDLREHFTVAVGVQERPVARRIAAALAARPGPDEEYLEELQQHGYELAPDDGGFDGPVTVLTGRCDRVVGYRDQLRMLESYPAGSFTVVAGAGHYLPFERPGRCAVALREWLASLPGERPCDT